MRKLGPGVGAPAIAGSFSTVASTSAAPALRVQVTQHGDFELIGNTLGTTARRPFRSRSSAPSGCVAPAPVMAMPIPPRPSGRSSA